MYVCAAAISFALCQILFADGDARPQARSGHALVYDEARHALLLLNGDHVLTGPGELWAWTSNRRRRATGQTSPAGAPWRLIDTSGPPPRTLAAVAYDSRRGVVVMQGGLGDGDTQYGDTVEWNGARWTVVSQDGGPGVRNHHAMAYDEARGVMVLFGGQDRNINLQNDTWEWDGTTWRQVATSGPPARVHHALVYDAVRRRVLLYGGSTLTGGLSDFWEWDGATWRQIDARSPGIRSAHRMAFHEQEGKVYLFGGFQADDRTWIWDGTSWTSLSGPAPAARGYHGMAYDGTRRSIVIFGGYSSGSSSRADTWELTGGRWVAIDPGQ